MPLKNSPGGGTNADGSVSTLYCAHCYADGKFRQPDITAQEMQAFVRNKLKEMGFPGFLASFFSRDIPKLSRWSS
ncbi:MAG: hypothetical protein RLY31_1897 [Bacteroidota bacterium]